MDSVNIYFVTYLRFFFIAQHNSTMFNGCSYTPRSSDWGHIVLGQSICLLVCTSAHILKCPKLLIQTTYNVQI